VSTQQHRTSIRNPYRRPRPRRPHRARIAAAWERREARVRTDYLDCCEQPTLEVVRPLYQASHDAETLMRCTRCQIPWFYRFSEYVTFDGPNDLTSWSPGSTTRRPSASKLPRTPPPWTSPS
jgi:hypothetical protein